jgi:glycosyltransferase involved in cell wall biosynthesis
MNNPTVCILASYAESLINFREPLLRALRTRGYNIIACAPPDAGVQRKLQGMGIEFISVPLQRATANPLADLNYLRRLVQLLRSMKPEATIAYTAKPVIWGSLAARIAGTPRICAMITGLGSAMLGTSGKQRLLARTVETLYRAALSACGRVAFQNPDDQSEFVGKGIVAPNKTFRVNGSGVLLDHFAPVALPAAPIFLLIARLLVDKGIREYVAAARIVKSRHPSAVFRLAGWFDENPAALSRSEVQSWVDEGLIEYLGRLDDVRGPLAAARFYVLPSYREGTPRTVLEAMAIGRPIITTDAPGCRETVRDGWNGRLVRLRDPEDLAAAMEQLLLDPQLVETMAVRSRELAMSKFDANAVANDLLTGFCL